MRSEGKYTIRFLELNSRADFLSLYRRSILPTIHACREERGAFYHWQFSDPQWSYGAYTAIGMTRRSPGSLSGRGHRTRKRRCILLMLSRSSAASDGRRRCRRCSLGSSLNTLDRTTSRSEGRQFRNRCSGDVGLAPMDPFRCRPSPHSES